MVGPVVSDGALEGASESPAPPVPGRSVGEPVLSDGLKVGASDRVTVGRNVVGAAVPGVGAQVVVGWAVTVGPHVIVGPVVSDGALEGASESPAPPTPGRSVGEPVVSDGLKVGVSDRVTVGRNVVGAPVPGVGAHVVVG